MTEAIESEIEKCQDAVKKEVMAAMFIHWADKFRYGSLKSTLAQHMSMETIQYPRLLKEAMNILNTYNKTTQGQQRARSGQKMTDNNTKMLFAQSSKGAGNKSDWDLSHITCFHCDAKGHYVKECTKRENYMHTTVTDKEEGEVEENIFQVAANVLSKDWLLLDNQSTVDQFVNAQFLTNISTAEQPMTVYCNAGCMTTKQEEMFRKLMVWEYPDWIVN